MGQPVLCLSSYCLVQRFDNIKPPILEILLFLEISWFSMLERGGNVLHLTHHEGGSGEQVCSGGAIWRAMLREDF